MDEISTAYKITPKGKELIERLRKYETEIEARYSPALAAVTTGWTLNLFDDDPDVRARAMERLVKETS